MADRRAAGAGAARIPLSAARDLAGRAVLVCGVGLAGASAARALLAAGSTVMLTDHRRPAGVAELVAAGAQFRGDLDALPAHTDLLVVSPGIRPDHPLPLAAHAAGVEVIGEAELAWRLRGPDAAPWLAVTGTNGKTTTVRMLESILLAAGARARAVGNVGVSLIDAVTGAEPWDVLAVELSSFQLHWSSSIAPAAGALLNLAPDHLDWHGSMAGYTEAKTRIWAGAVAIGNLDDADVAMLLAHARSTPVGRPVGVTTMPPTDGTVGVLDGVIVDRAFDGGASLAPVSAVRPVGAHNVANAVAAAALARAHGVAAEAVAAGLGGFRPDPHRNQFLASHRDVRFVDDSKATNAHAAAASLSAYDPVVWIAGGQLKGAPVEELVRRHAGRLRAVVLLGADRSAIATALSRHAPDVPVIEVATTDDGAMTEVVRAAARFARAGDTVLLAPAAASYDMFTGYAARGAAFAAAVHQLVAETDGIARP